MARAKTLFRFEQASGLLMAGAILLALAAANSPLASTYRFIHHMPVHVRLGPLVIDEPLVQWINEGLMVFIFLLVGLDIKRQFLEGASFNLEMCSFASHCRARRNDSSGGRRQSELLYPIYEAGP